MAWSYRDFENSFLEFVKNLRSDSTIEQSERKAVEDLISRIQALSVTDPYDARIEIAIALKSMVSELKIASAGVKPIMGKSDARIRRDGPGRYFEVRLRGGSPRIAFPIGKYPLGYQM